MYEELNNNTGSGSYYDTNGGYVHYDSQSQMNQPKKRKKAGLAGPLPNARYLRSYSEVYPAGHLWEPII